MGRQVKCPYCETKLDQEDAISHQKRYYHPNCLEAKKNESQDYKDLIEYICELHGISRPTGMMVKQIKEFRNDYNYKLKGIELALRYFYETESNPVREGDGIGIVPYIYDKARDHYVTILNVEESVENAELPQEKVVSVLSPKPKKIKRRNPINISTL
ncbi:hypothetical protein SAMN05421503_1474 [Terribacillus aidingensis]|uniref:Uncharacterized protein n=1 Tax=Terribacillus aidingensis TaxID=586416 RepID=A0A285NKN0_9BACI|nr:hypothetical protein [Terribacillus aidingensis]SNZ10019.1 hypothetical protein SAMN05421503_1474 [Terribacillus aidingensis]